MSSIEVSKKGFLYDTAATVPLFREGNIPDNMIVAHLEKIKGAYITLGTTVSDDMWQAALDHYKLPGAKQAPVQSVDGGTVV